MLRSRGASTIWSGIHLPRFSLFQQHLHSKSGPPFHYYPAYALPVKPVPVNQYVFNAASISPANPYGLVEEDSNHRVYKARSLSGEITYLKDLSYSKVSGPRDEAAAQFLAYQESFANWLMYPIFGPKLIPKVFPVRYKTSWGIASSEIKYDGTLSQLAERLGYGQKEIDYGESALKVVNGETVLDLGQKQKPLRVVGRIGLKVALRLLVAHYDVRNHHKNVFMVFMDNPLSKQLVASPGIFDLGCVFCPARMNDLITAFKNPQTRETLITDFARKPVDAYIEELNVEDYEKITNRFPAKHAAFDKIARLPSAHIQTGLAWFKANVSIQDHEYVDTIGEYLAVTQQIAMAVCDRLDSEMQLVAVDNPSVLGSPG